MSSDLKRCPFCNGKAHAKRLNLIEIAYDVICEQCKIRTTWSKTEEEAIATWNRRADEWIAVEDGLPEPGAFVLAFIKGRPEVGRFIGVGWSFRTWWAGATDVTHWMPLPEPPKVKGK